MSRPLPAAGKRARLGTLSLVATFLIGSALIRAGLGIGPAISAEPEPRDAGAEAAETVPRAGADPGSLLARLQERERKLAERERRIEDRSRALEQADAALRQKLVALESAEERLRATIAMAEGASEDDISGLTAVYERMKPRESAALFETMTPEFAAGFLSRMRPEAAAAILSGLSPEAAYAVSVVLAGRNANVPTQ
ncbi:MotE family protein [Pontibaca methylaminivorans]|uniref:Flagellar motility protein MotE, a chaperone for MotC folding n=1 Tax=Pontibaca methylaminivorans TaxID=515897 RepID=A0A1R3WE77_9RHOB|nr:hypothetical protein [Pontibaca methylaminivorans]SIT75462.1 Flagellar motility protein MotE, a chaperone for MotC folding [Pontibaca methylaminivorans]